MKYIDFCAGNLVIEGYDDGSISIEVDSLHALGSIAVFPVRAEVEELVKFLQECLE